MMATHGLGLCWQCCCHLWPLTALAGMVVGMGMVMMGGDRVVEGRGREQVVAL
jgi:hypothetical protein